MSESKLKIIQSDKELTKKQKVKIKYDRLWLDHPEKFDPHNNAIEITRIERTFEQIYDLMDYEGKKVADIGCGYGTIAKMLCKLGADVDGVEVSEYALKRLEPLENFHHVQDMLPQTKLKSDYYDLVVCADVVAELNQSDRRLAISELCRLVKNEGFVVITSAVDIYSEDALKRLLSLVETEFNVDTCIVSHHYLFIRLLKFLKAPALYWHGYQNHQFRREQLDHKQGFFKGWYALQSSAPLAWMWKGCDIILKPIRSFIRTNTWILEKLESISRFFWNEGGISHAIIVGTQRPLFSPDEHKPMPDRPPFTKETKWT